MLKLIRNRAGLVLAGLIAALAPMLMAPSGGFPFNPTFGSVTVGNTARTDTPSVGVLSAATGQPTFETVANGYAATCLTANNSGGVGACSMPTGHAGIAQTAQPIDFHGTGLQFNEVDFSPTDSGALTWSFQTATSPNCSTNGTNATVQLHKVGKVVTAMVTASGSCTCASCGNVVTNNTPVPAAFRPAQTVGCGVSPITLPAASIGSMCVTSAGNFQVFTNGGTATTLGISVGNAFTYSTD